MKQIHILYSGRVQGVGFRFTARRIARHKGLCGWVKNLPGTEVEILAEGEEPDLVAFCDEIEEYFSGSITNKEIQFAPFTGAFTDFSIAF